MIGRAFALCLLVCLARTFRPTATTSLPPPPSPQVGGPSSSFQLQQQQQLASEGTNDQQLVLQLALVSARDSLAFWRPPTDESAQTNQLEPSQALGSSSSSRPSQIIINNHSKCPQLSSGGNIKTPSSAAELLAVEGSSVKLNFVIVGSLKQHAKQPPIATIQQQLAGSKLSFRWTKNGQPLPVVSQHSSSSVVGKQRVGASHHLSQRHQFSELIINENDIIRRYFANLPASSMALPGEAPFLGQRDPVHLENEADSLNGPPYVLAPYFNERQIARLRFDAQLDSLLRLQLQQKVIRWHPHHPGVGGGASGGGFRPSAIPTLVDEFLADAQLIDWQRLESYLKQNANQLRLYLPPPPLDRSPTDEQARQVRASDCPQLLASHQIEQLTIVQLETSRLGQHDAGLYSLEACTTGARCQSMGFRLHVAQDWPILERTFEHHILEPGDRLSIKCEATGFTLPQITWFLDGQQLNEHKSPVMDFTGTSQLDRHSTLATAAAAAAAAGEADPDEESMKTSSTNLRVGDYVSQDNHVHSFVNSSRLQLTDGGLYRCQANNGFHLVEHEARVDVRGPATFARQLSNQSLLLSVDSQLRVQCPFSGYPISSIEWFFKSASVVPAKHEPQQQPAAHSPSDADQEYLPQQRSYYLGSSASGIRSKRLSEQQQQQAESYLDEEREPDPERDGWLSQAGAITPPNPPPNDDYPLPADYLAPFTETYFSDNELNSYGSSRDSADLLDYGDLQMDMQQQQSSDNLPLDRRRRDALSEDQQWVKLPQSRRHQVHLNGTLIVQELSRYDQGSYKCRVGSGANNRHDNGGGVRLISSNEFHLSILVPPVISPFSSADSLREGMRNFLTCSVIEGDSPIRLTWLKDNQPIEDYIELTSISISTSASSSSSSAAAVSAPTTTNQNNRGDDPRQPASTYNRQPRIRVETSNEYTSTLYFSHVDFRDNGNYTCMATNKAARVNYTAKMLVNVPPKWVKVPKDLEFTAGQNIAIDCQAKAHPSARLWWEIGIGAESIAASQTNRSLSLAAAKLPNDKSTAAANHPPLHYRTIISNSRIHILENATLVIRDLQPSDQGYYLCQASNNFGSLSSLIKLTVNVGASFTSKYLLKYAKLGERVELDCDPNGQSPLELSWFWRHPSTNMGSSSSSSSTTSSPLAAAAATMFQKQNNSSLGQPLFTGILQSDEPAKLPAGDLLLPQETPEALRAKISFEQAPPTIVGANSPLESVHRLIIGSASRQHSADFVCRASNRYGSDEKLIKLLVQEAPDQVHDLQPVQVESRSATINWPIPYNGNTPITGYTVEWAPALHHQHTINMQQQQQPRKWSHIQVQQPAVTITGLSPLTSYEVRVRAHNQLGQSAVDTLSALLLATGEEAPNVPPSDIRAQPLSSSSMQLSWSVAPSADDQPRWQASIKGYYLGYRLANSSTASTSSDSFVFKTVPSSSSSPPQSEGHQSATDNTTMVGQDSAARANPQRVRVVIDDLKRATKYSIIVQAFNSAGPGPQSDPIEARTLLDDPPPMPMLRVGSVTFTSIELQWNFPTSSQHYHHSSSSSSSLASPAETRNTTANENESVLIEGFQLYYRSTVQSQTGAWLERKLKPETHTMLTHVGPRGSSSSSSVAAANQEISIVPLTDQAANSIVDRQQAANPGWQKSGLSARFTAMRFTLDQLECGNSYQVYLVAYNSIGSGEPSQIVRTRTRGQAPIAPRKQEFLVPNSTLALLNLDTWADGGCTISNFEVRYKQRASHEIGASSPRASSINPASLVSASQALDTGGQQQQQHQPWLLVASQISPDQRQMELRDLQPESWYSVWVLAESAAGKSEAQYTFMTLDKFGRLPLEALEIGTNAMPASNGPVHALFSRYSNGSLVRSLLYNFGSQANNVSPMLMSACLALILFATCSLFLIRRYNNQQPQQQQQQQQQLRQSDNNKDNDGSIDYDHHRIGTACSSDYHRHRRLGCSGGAGASSQVGAQVIAGGHDHLTYGAHKGPPMMMEASSSSDYGHLAASGLAMAANSSASPCKTSTTILTGSNHSTSNGSSSTQGVSLCGLSSFRPQSAQLDLSRFMGDVAAAAAASGQTTNNYTIQPTQYNSSTLAHHFNHQCNAGDTADDRAQNLPTDHDEMMVQRFKTMPHQQRANCDRQYSTYCNGPDDQQQQQQQIYSKLRLLQYNNNNSSNYSGGCLKSDHEQPVYDANTINLAVLSQQHHQKALFNSAKRQAVANCAAAIAAGGSCSLQADGLLDCSQQQALVESLDIPAYGQQQQQYCAPVESGAPTGNGYAAQAYGQVGGSSIVSGSSSTNISSSVAAAAARQQSMMSDCDNTQASQQQQEQEQSLISLTNEVNAIGNQCSKSSAQSNKINSLGGCLANHHHQQQSPMLLAANNNGNPNTNPNQANNGEQTASDYALPFPPKWV